MSIKRYIADKDNTINNAFKSNLSSRGSKGNTGASDILEVFSIFGQASSASVEQSRILIQFPVSQIASDRASNAIPQSGSVNFFVKLSNASHNQTTPDSYDLCVSPLTRQWEEGIGLDMESYLNEDASSWNSATDFKLWSVTGSDYASYGNIHSSTSPVEIRSFVSGSGDDVLLDVTSIVEDQISYINGNGLEASSSITFKSNPPPQSSTVIKLTDHEGTSFRFQYTSGSTGSIGDIRMIESGSTTTLAIQNLKAAIDLNFSGTISASVSSAVVSLRQVGGGYFGNTIISASDNSQFQNVKTHFSGGAGAPNYGYVVKLSGSYESGARSRSYYTKKLFSRTSQYFYKRPYIEAQWESAIKDDRHDIIKSSSLAPAEENLNRIYLYNKRRNGLVDIPTTGSDLLVQLFSSLGSVPVTASGESVSAANPTFITASRYDTGIYEAKFAYSGDQSSLVDVWQTSGSTTGYVHLHTGSAFSVYGSNTDSFFETPDYSFNVTNLKSSYNPREKVTLRVYTRDRNYKTNVYTKSTTNVPSNTVRNAFYEITRVADSLVVIPYSTGSAQNYSGLSYDASGSYFNIDMGLFEPNYMYEIGLLYKDGSNYIEASERFKFRVDP